MTKSERMAFVLHTRKGRCLAKAAEILAPFAGALIVLAGIWFVETRFFPVITDWQLEYIQRHGGAFHMGGVLRKARTCELVSTDVLAVPRNPLAPRVTVYRVAPHEFAGSQVSTGLSEWGPWSVMVPKALDANRDKIDRIEVVGVHRCHAFWLQETLYGAVPIDRIPR